MKKSAEPEAPQLGVGPYRYSHHEDEDPEESGTDNRKVGERGEYSVVLNQY